MKFIWQTAVMVYGLTSLLVVQGCLYGPMRAPTSAGMVVYTKGARQHTATVQLMQPPAEVYAAMLRIVAQRPDLQVIDKNDKRYLLELTSGEKRLTGQATELDANSTLLFIRADAGNSGTTGRDLARDAMTQLCTELGVKCTMQDI